jgi:hypothetical protein
VPRSRDVTMKKLDPKDLRNAAIKRAMKLYSPYEVVAEELVDLDGDGYAVVYRAPLGGDRYVAATRSRRENATKLRDLLDRAWAEGKASSGRE